MKERTAKIILLCDGRFLLLGSLLGLLHTLLIRVLWTFISHVTHPPFHKIEPASPLSNFITLCTYCQPPGEVDASEQGRGRGRAPERVDL